MNQQKISKASVFVFITLSLSCTNLVAYRKISTTNHSSWPYFYLVKKDGKTHYILGEMHVAVALDELPCADEIKQALKESSVLFSEKSNVWDTVFQKERTYESDPELEYLYTQNGIDVYRAQNDFTFRSFSPSVQNFFAERGISKKLTYSGYNTAITRLCFTDAYDPLTVRKSIPEDVIKMAKLQGIPIKPLDTPELRDQCNELYTLESIESDVQTFSECPENVQNLKNYYLSDNVLEFINLSEQFISLVLRNRNQEWLSKFLLAHQQHSQIFISAGSLHFTGPDNLLDMLREEGFEVSLSKTCKVIRKGPPPIQPKMKPKMKPKLKPLQPNMEFKKIKMKKT